MSFDPLTTVSSIRTELENGWKLFDDAWAPFTARDWSRKFGRTWTYAEQPYHMMYFDRTMAKFIGYGSNIPPGEQWHARSMGELNAWNDREFARRPRDHSVQDSLSEMKRVRDDVRALLNGVNDADLDRAAFAPLIFGWATVRDLFQAMIVHNVAEYWKLWIRTGKRGPAPSPSAVHLRLGFMMNFMALSMNKAEARRGPFTMSWNFIGPGGGTWTFIAHEDSCTVLDSAAERADLVITIRPEDFHRIVAKMTPPPLLMLTGKMRVKGLMAMGRFGKLFPEPEPDTIIDTGPKAPVG